MKQVIIFHDAFSNPLSAWYQSVQSIIPDGYTFLSPELPGGTEQGMTFWMQTFEKVRSGFNDSTIVITHGISTFAWLRFLETMTQPVRMTIIVAGCDQVPGHQVLAPIAKSFLTNPFNYSLVTKNAGTVIHITNTSDPFISPTLSRDLQSHISGEMITLSGVGHFTETTETELIQTLQSIFQKTTAHDAEVARLKLEHRAQAEKEELAKSLVPGVITYDSTKAQSLSGYQGKVISELLAEAREEDLLKKEQSPKSIKNVFYILGTILFLIAGAWFIISALQRYQPKIAPIINRGTQSYQNTIMQVSEFTSFDITNLASYEILKNFNALQQKEIPEKSFFAIVPKVNEKIPPLETFFTSLDIRSPLGFTSKSRDYLYSYYKPEGISEKIPFLLIRFDGYEIMHTLLSGWEPRMIIETRTLFQKKQAEFVTQPEAFPFEDVVINNIVLRKGSLSTSESLYYGFITNTVLLITPNPAVLDPIVRSMNNTTAQ